MSQQTRRNVIDFKSFSRSLPCHTAKQQIILLVLSQKFNEFHASWFPHIYTWSVIAGIRSLHWTWMEERLNSRCSSINIVRVRRAILVNYTIDGGSLHCRVQITWKNFDFQRFANERFSHSESFSLFRLSRLTSTFLLQIKAFSTIYNERDSASLMLQHALSPINQVARHTFSHFFVFFYTGWLLLSEQ